MQLDHKLCISICIFLHVLIVLYLAKKSNIYTVQSAPAVIKSRFLGRYSYLFGGQRAVFRFYCICGKISGSLQRLRQHLNGLHSTANLQRSYENLYVHCPLSNLDSLCEPQHDISRKVFVQVINLNTESLNFKIISSSACAPILWGGQSSRGAYPDPPHPRNIAHICINNHTFRRGIDRVYVELVKYDRG